MLKRIKKSSILCLCLIAIFCFVASPINETYADTCGGVNTALITCKEGGDGGVYHVIGLVIDAFSIGVGILAVAGILWSGTIYITSGQSEDRATTAKRRIYDIVLGLMAYVVLWSLTQWLLPGGVLNPNKDNTGVVSITVSYNHNGVVGKTFIPKVNFNNDAKDKTYSLMSSDSSIATTLGNTVKCISEGSATIKAIAPNGLTGDAVIKCVELDNPNEDPDSKEPASNEIETIGNTSDMKLTKKPKMRKETRNIVESHNKDFFRKEGSKSYATVVLGKNSKYGSYKKYVESLGGVFKQFANQKRIKITTAADFQVAAEYVYGLMAIWGPDYRAGQQARPENWGGKEGDDAFYQGYSGRGGLSYTSNDGINKILSKSNSKSIDINCDKMANIFIKSTNLKYPSGGTSNGGGQSRHLKMSKYEKNGGKITKVSELQVGDVVNFFSNGGGHVALVGEVYKNKVVFYDGGPFFQRSKQYKFAVDRRDDNKLTDKYSIYGSWYGWRPWKINQDVTLKGIN